MRIGCLQFAPVKGDVNNTSPGRTASSSRRNLKTWIFWFYRSLLSQSTGYYFKSLNEIFPHLEPSGSGTTSLWARTAALKYDCTVVVGYPEKVDVTNKWPASPEYYNSALIVDSEGQTTGGYRKSHLYSIDETWALEGQGGFYTGNIAGAKNATLGISMDITPYRLEAPYSSFEFANRVLQLRSDLVIVSLAWPTNQEGRLFSRMPQEPDMETLMHWISRLEPIIQKESDEEVIVVFANRTGNEDGVVYAGSSAVLGIKAGEVNVYGILGRSDRELLVVDTDKEPYGKLVYRPGANGTPLASSQRFFNNGAALDSKPPPPPPPPPSSVPVTDSREGDEAPDDAAGGPSISEVLHANGPIAIPSPALSPRLRDQPKLSLRTDPEQLEPPFPSVATPTGPSPTPFSRRPRITIPPADSWTRRYIDSHMKSPVRHPMEIIPPPAQIYGGEVAILQSPLYSAVGGPPPAPWDSPSFGETAVSPARSDTTEFTGLSSPKTAMAMDLPFRLETQSGSNATARRCTPAVTEEVIIGPPPPRRTPAPRNDKVGGDTPKAQRAGKSETGGRPSAPPPPESGQPKATTKVDGFVLPEKPPPVSPPPLLPLTYVAPLKPQRPLKRSQSSIAQLAGRNQPQAPPKERRSRSSATRVGGESHGDVERGRSAGPDPPPAQPTSRSATPINKGREERRGRSRTKKLGETRLPPERPKSKRKNRSTSTGTIDLSQFRLIEERPSASCAIHGIRARSASQDQALQLVPTTDDRPASARRQRTARTTPVMSNLSSATYVERTPPPMRKINTQVSHGTRKPSPIVGPKPRSPAMLEEQSTSMVGLSPAPASPSPTVSHFGFGGFGGTTFHFSWSLERKSWVESWLPTLSGPAKTGSTPSPQRSPPTPIKDPTTPRAMVTAAEVGSTGNAAISFVKALESVAIAPEMTRA